MEERRRNFELFCSFYVSDWHLVTMILPYINTQINKNVKVATILENDIEEKIIELMEKLNLKNKEKIEEINWKAKKEIKNEEICKVLNKNNKVLLIVNGSKKFIDEINKNIKLILNEIEYEEEKNIKIVNCYDVMEFNSNIQEILDNHDKIINTSGEKEISEIFNGYKRKIMQ